MTSTYQVLLNNGNTVAVSSDLFEKLPKDSMLHSLLKEDQEMAKKDENGHYLLTLDHPEMFEFALQSIEKPDLNCYNLHEATKTFYSSFLEAMKAFVATLDYLQFPVPEPYKPFMADYAPLLPIERGDRVLKEARKQLCDLALNVQQLLIKNGRLFIACGLKIADARRMKKESVEVELTLSMSIFHSDIYLGFDAKSGLQVAEKFGTAMISDLYEDFNDVKWSPLYMLLAPGDKTSLALLDEYFVPIIVETFCKINSVTLINFGSSLGKTEHDSRKLLNIKVKVDLRK
ncbi:hypothetical protein MP638_005893 [Amoeboaphelidium occidentale]|nr:hypothetical protein MP638_005893 [Amoeboaphelidium occidentale]